MIDSLIYMYIINVDLSDVLSLGKFFFEMRFKLKVSIEKKNNLLNFHNNNLLFNVFPFLIFGNCVWYTWIQANKVLNVL